MLKTLSRLMPMIALTLALSFASGCQTDRPRVVLVPPITTNPLTLEPTDIIKVGPDVRGRIYVRTKNGWELSDNEVPYEEGWFMIPPSKNGESK